MDAVLKPIFSPDEIRAMVEEIAALLRRDLASRNPILVGVLKGAAVFLSDLIRAVDMPLEVDYMQASCYGMKDAPTEEAALISDVCLDVRGRDVVVVDGIADTGRTAEALLRRMRSKAPASVRFCALFVRKGRERSVKVDYFGAEVDEGFIVGYGLDFREAYRHLPGAYMLVR